MVDTENIARLTKRIREIRTYCMVDANTLIKAYHWNPNKDLRITSIKRFSRLIIGLDVSFAYLLNSDQNTIIERIRLPGEEQINLEQYLLCNEIFLKIGFASSLFFIIEGVLKNYLQFLDEQVYKNKKGIKNVCDCLLNEKLKWEIVRFDCSVFDFLRLIRNTLHNNGVHLPLSAKEKNIQIEYKGKIYDFRDGERIDFVTWDLLLDITNDMRTLLFHLANNKTIREIVGMIPDKLAL